MVLESIIAQVVEQQKKRLLLRDSRMKRELIPASQKDSLINTKQKL